MRERPILFSAPMVRAILDGKKTQTRRVVKFPAWMQDCDGGQARQIPKQFDGYVDMIDVTVKHVEGYCNCPFGDPGDRLWGKECWRFGYPVHADGPSMNIKTLQYRADYGDDANLVPWRPSIHMIREDSRITLEVVTRRIERLQEISPEDALREGVFDYAQQHNLGGYWTTAFRRIWDSINGPESWLANLWVWVVEFKRIDA